MSNELFTIHDAFFKKSLEHFEIAKDFFTAHLPVLIQKRIDLETLRVEKGSFIDKHYKKLSTDMLFSVKLNSSPELIYLLVEHQSSAHKLMPLRMLQYMTRVLNQYKDKKNSKLSVVVPFVYYHGKQLPYPYSIDIVDYFSTPELAEAVMIKPFKLIDLTVMDDAIIQQHKYAAVMEMLQKYFFMDDISVGVDKLLETGSIELILSLEDGEYFEIVLKYICQAKSQDIEKLLDKMVRALPDAKEKIMNIAETLEYRGLQKGLQKGLQEGGQQRTYQIAKTLLEQGVDPRIIALATHLSEKELDKLAKEESLV